MNSLALGVYGAIACVAVACMHTYICEVECHKGTVDPRDRGRKATLKA